MSSALVNQEWNRMATRMNAFHNHFREEYRQIHALADSYEKRGLSFKRFVEFALGFNDHLTMHHSIEDQYIFPVLSLRMPEFKPESEHPESHRLIHRGLDDYVAYLQSVKSTPDKYTPQDLRSKLEAFHDVLFKHLDEEVVSLSRPNMEKYWTLEEVKRLPI